ncbi:ankyrin repeat domain-containing protein [Streptomyces decoyicus]|uniref:ankyrin repeat domain-containing protein n=1 Tax=Streptomyces decoyicus TaxID=249567 RepID=UPI0036296FD7
MGMGMGMVDQLTRAADDGDATLVARLLGEGVGVDAPDCEGHTALDLAARRGHADVVRLLIAAGADPEQRAGEYQESTPLCLAAAHGHTAVVGELLDAGVHTGAQGRMGYAPLVLAATTGDEGHPEAVDLLLDHGADIHVVMKGRTPLDWAVWFGQVPMVQQLLDRGATPTVKALTTAHARCERHPAARQKYERIIDALLAADPATCTDPAIPHEGDQEDRTGTTPSGMRRR